MNRIARVSSHLLNDGVARYFADSLRKYGFKVSSTESCLCCSELRDGRDFPNIVFSHPADSTNIGIDTKKGLPNCWEVHRQVIQNHPGIEFYVLALGEYAQRKQAIGDFPNLKYLRMANVQETFEELKERIIMPRQR